MCFEQREFVNSGAANITCSFRGLDYYKKSCYPTLWLIIWRCWCCRKCMCLAVSTAVHTDSQNYRLTHRCLDRKKYFFQTEFIPWKLLHFDMNFTEMSECFVRSRYQRWGQVGCNCLSLPAMSAFTLWSSLAFFNEDNLKGHWCAQTGDPCSEGCHISTFCLLLNNPVQQRSH